jgi:integrase
VQSVISDDGPRAAASADGWRCFLDEKPRTRVAPLEEAEQLLAALEPDYQVPYALAFYAGLRRAEIYRLRWEDVELDGYRQGVDQVRRNWSTLLESVRDLRATIVRAASEGDTVFRFTGSGPRPITRRSRTVG